MLSDDQRTILERRDEPRVLVAGTAGTGKTELALALAHAWSEEGRSVLMLSATEPLARHLRRRASPEVSVSGIPALARRLLRRVDAEPDLDDDEYWEQLPREAAEVVLLGGDGWDCVIVDGAADLHEGAWELAEACAVGGTLWAFHDPRRTFWEDREVPERLFDARRELWTNHRGRLMPLASRYLALPDEEPDVGPERPFVRVVDGEGEAATVAAVSTILDERGPAALGLVSVRGRRERRALPQLDTHLPMRSASADEGFAGDTFLRFAGLERDAIVVTDLHLVEDRYEERMYQAVSRARRELIVVGPRALLEHDEVLYPFL